MAVKPVSASSPAGFVSWSYVSCARTRPTTDGRTVHCMLGTAATAGSSMSSTERSRAEADTVSDADSVDGAAGGSGRCSGAVGSRAAAVTGKGERGWGDTARGGGGSGAVIEIAGAGANSSGGLGAEGKAGSDGDAEK